jgi:diamine N-acetyltransferase
MKAELGLVILRACRHQGYAAATILKMHDYARHTLHLHQIYVVISASNDNTLRLFQQMGYQQSACLTDWLFDGERYHDAIVMQHVL